MSAVSLVRRIALPGFALSLLCGCASHERPVSVPTTSQPRAARELRVMTFNLRVRTILAPPAAARFLRGSAAPEVSPIEQFEAGGLEENATHFFATFFVAASDVEESSSG